MHIFKHIQALVLRLRELLSLDVASGVVILQEHMIILLQMMFTEDIQTADAQQSL